MSKTFLMIGGLKSGDWFVDTIYEFDSSNYKWMLRKALQKIFFTKFSWLKHLWNQNISVIECDIGVFCAISINYTKFFSFQGGEAGDCKGHVCVNPPPERLGCLLKRRALHRLGDTYIGKHYILPWLLLGALVSIAYRNSVKECSIVCRRLVIVNTVSILELYLQASYVASTLTYLSFVIVVRGPAEVGGQHTFVSFIQFAAANLPWYVASTLIGNWKLEGFDWNV